VTTDEAAECRYATNANTAFEAMSDTFAITGFNSHSTTISGLWDDNAYTYYVRCRDTDGNANTDDYAISFSVAVSGEDANHAPVLADISDITVTEEETVTFNPTASDQVTRPKIKNQLA
jgi:hypothetical protein